MYSQKNIKIVIFLILIISSYSIYYTFDEQTNQISLGIDEVTQKFNNSYVKKELYINNFEIKFSNQFNNISTKINKENSKIIIDLQYLYPFSGSWTIKNNRYSQESKGQAVSFINYPSYNPSKNFIVKLKAKPDANGVIGIAFGIAGPGNMYIFRLDSGSYSQIYKQKNFEDVLLQSKYSPFLLGKWYDFKIVVNETSIKTYIDSTPQHEVDGSIDYNGKLGIFSVDRAEFSDMLIYTSTTNTKIDIILNYHIISNGFNNISIMPYLIEKNNQSSGNIQYNQLFEFKNISYDVNNELLDMSDSINFSTQEELIRPPNLIFFPTENYNRTFAIRLIAKGWDEEKQEWIFKEFMSPEFTWEDVVEGRTITGGNGTG